MSATGFEPSIPESERPQTGDYVALLVEKLRAIKRCKETLLKPRKGVSLEADINICDQ